MSQLEIDEEQTTTWADWLRCFTCLERIQFLKDQEGSTHLFCPKCNRMIGSAELHKRRG